MDKMQRIQLDLLLKTRFEGRSKMVAAIIRSRTDAMEAVSRVLGKAIPLARQAFSLDSEKGEVQSITYVTPEMKRPPGTGLSGGERGSYRHLHRAGPQRRKWRYRIQTLEDRCRIHP